MNDVRYRIYLGRDDKVTVVCVQDNDLPDYKYKEERFFKDEDGGPVEFKSEDEAKTCINARFKRECIDPEYLDTQNLFADKLK